jgi:hypothetical protein
MLPIMRASGARRAAGSKQISELVPNAAQQQILVPTGPGRCIVHPCPVYLWYFIGDLKIPWTLGAALAAWQDPVMALLLIHKTVFEKSQPRDFFSLAHLFPRRQCNVLQR